MKRHYGKLRRSETTREKTGVGTEPRRPIACSALSLASEINHKFRRRETGGKRDKLDREITSLVWVCKYFPQFRSMNLVVIVFRSQKKFRRRQKKVS